MKSLPVLLVCLVLTCITTTAQPELSSCCGGISYHSVNTTVDVPGQRWILFQGVAIRRDLQTGTSHASRQLATIEGMAALPVMKVDQTTFPTLIRYTSLNSPLVQEPIVRIMIDDSQRLWALNELGDVSMFDGSKWETIRRVGKTVSTSDCSEGLLDLSVGDGKMRIVTPEFLDEIDMRTLQRTCLAEFDHCLNQPLFVDFNLIIDRISDVAVHVDRPLNMLSVVALRDSLHGSRLLQRTSISTSGRRTVLHAATQEVVNGPMDQELRSVNSTLLHFQDLHNQRAFRQQLFELGLRETTSNVYRLERGWSRYCDYHDMIADVNGTIYLAGRDGITVIPSTAGGVATKVVDTTLAALQLHPNPASNQVLVEIPGSPTEDVTMQLIDASGTTVRSLPLHERSTTLDVSAYPSGMYTVVVSTSTKRVARSLVIRR